MSYVQVTSRLEFDFPHSTVLHRGFFDASEGIIGVAFHSNPVFFYEHTGCTQEDLDELFMFIDNNRSAGTGYRLWKEERKERFQVADRQRFDELWYTLNEYQRQNFIDWFAEKAKKHANEWGLPIYVRRGDWLRKQ